MMYKAGNYLGYRYDAKVYDEPSRLGIDNGRILKLAVYEYRNYDHREVIVNYDRGWDIWPKDAGHCSAYREIKRRLLE